MGSMDEEGDIRMCFPLTISYSSLALLIFTTLSSPFFSPFLPSALVSLLPLLPSLGLTLLSPFFYHFSLLLAPRLNVSFPSSTY